MSDEELAEYIIRFLRRRNGGQLDSCGIKKMRVQDYELTVRELAMILDCRGKPPNWVDPPESEKP